MKRLFYITIAICAVLIPSSCSKDFLNLESPDKLYVDEYYTNESRIFEALVAAYDPLQWFDYGWGQYTHLGLVSDVMADDVYVGGSDANDCIYLHRMSNYEALPTSVVSDLWTAFYSGVNRSNIVLQYMDNVQDIPEKSKALYLAEAKVLRSFYYTWLWKLWGNIPYYEANLTYPYIKDQNTADEVYQGIVTTLEDAISTGGLPMKVASGQEGRVSLAMAYMLYAEVVMYKNDESRFNKALEYMELIIKSEQYDLMNDFSKIWEEDGEWSQESIFEINYFSRNGTRSWNNPLSSGGSVYPKLIGLYNLSGSPEYDGGWGFEPVKASTYELYEAKDERRDGGILNFATYSAQTGAKYEPRYQDQGYFLRKYMARKNGNANHSADGDLNYNNNFRVYRYAETLLNAAELLARGASGLGSAQTYLEKVRKRANLDNISPSVENIIKERRLEFVGEGKRYWDLVRSGYAPNYLKPDGLYRTNTWTVAKKYLPIPQSEIDAAAGTLTQNNY